MTGYDHKPSDETPDWWFDRIECARKVFEDTQQRHYRREIKAYHDMDRVPLVRKGEDSTERNVASKYDVGGVEQIDLVYLPRHAEWHKSQAYDSTPEVRFPRTGPHGNILGEFCEELCEIVGRECDEIDEYRLTVNDVMEHGSYVVFYGIHSRATVTETLTKASLSADDAVQIVLALLEQGREYKAWPGQNHEAISEVMRARAHNPEILEGARGAMIQQALIYAAGQHDEQAKADAKMPNERNVERMEVYAERQMIGENFLWDVADDFRDARAIYRRVVFDVDVARKHPAFKPSVARTLQPGLYEKGSGFRGSVRDTVRDSVDSDKVLSDKVVTWNIIDLKRNQSRWISEGVEVFLEIDPSDPHGGAVPGFPCTYAAPSQSRTPSPQRPHGKPLQANMVPVQRAIIKLASYDIEAVFKQSVRMTMGMELGDAEADFTGGVSGTHIPISEDFMDRFLAGSDPIRPIKLGDTPRDMAQRLGMYLTYLAHMGAWPLSQMTGEPQSNTATGEVTAVSGGKSQMADLTREMQKAYARGQDIKLALVQRWYSKDQLMEMLPARYFNPLTENGPSTYDLFMEMSFEGVQCSAKFTPEAQNEDALRRSQIREGIEFVSQLPGPAPGLPMYGPDALKSPVEEYWKTLAMGAPTPTPYTQEQIERALQIAAEASQRGGQNKNSGKSKRDSRPGAVPVEGKQRAGSVRT